VSAKAAQHQAEVVGDLFGIVAKQVFAAKCVEPVETLKQTLLFSAGSTDDLD